MVAASRVPELPVNLKYVRAILNSEYLLQQQADSVFVRCDVNKNGQIERDELQYLCSAMHETMGLHTLDQGKLERQLKMFDADLSGTLDALEFVGLYKNLLQEVMRAALMETPPANLGEAVSSKPPRSLARNVDDIVTELPSEPRFLRAVLSSKLLLEEQARKVFLRCDHDVNGQIDRDELHDLCRAMHQILGLRLPDEVGVGLQLARFDTDFSGGLDRMEFLNLYRQLLKDALETMTSAGPSVELEPLDERQAIVSRQPAVGDEVMAPYLGEQSGRRYRALVSSISKSEDGVDRVGLRWLRPTAGLHPEEYVVGNGLDDTDFMCVPSCLVAICPLDESRLVSI